MHSLSPEQHAYGEPTFTQPSCASQSTQLVHPHSLSVPAQIALWSQLPPTHSFTAQLGPGHDVPSVSFPVATQLGPPPTHWISPVRQASPGSHDVPGVQGTHVPLPSHTPPGQLVSVGAAGKLQLPPAHWFSVQSLPSAHTEHPLCCVSVFVTV